MGWVAGLPPLILLLHAATASAVTIDITLAPEQVDTATRVTFVIGVVETGTTSGVDINGFTLDYRFDQDELTFVGAEQLVTFGTLGRLDFSTFGDCTAGRCTAGNVPGFDGADVKELFSLTFDALSLVDDGLPDLEVGILDQRFDDVTQATGRLPFDHGTVVQPAYVTPEPSTGSLIGIALAALARRRRRMYFTSSRAPATAPGDRRTG